MGLLSFFKSDAATPTPLPTGSFTVDRQGRILTSTVVSTFPREKVAEVAQTVLGAFQKATQAGLILSELVLDYGELRVKARELRGGAIVFFVRK